MTANGQCMRCTIGAVFCLLSAKGVTGSMAYDTMLAVVNSSFLLDCFSPFFSGPDEIFRKYDLIVFLIEITLDLEIFPFMPNSFYKRFIAFVISDIFQKYVLLADYRIINKTPVYSILKPLQRFSLIL